jgi:hypothetical protein
MKNKLIEQYTEKIGTPPTGERINLNLLGVASPSFGAAHTLNLLIHRSPVDATSEQTLQIQEAIAAQTQAFMTDEATAAAELLFGQVVILNTAFNQYMNLATLSANTPHFGTFFDAAMKAQEQARNTIKTLHDIKNPKPKTVFIKNAIVQQVNKLLIKTEELQKQFETQTYATMDFGSTKVTERLPEVIDLPPASVGTIDGANKRGRKGKSRPQLS